MGGIPEVFGKSQVDLEAMHVSIGSPKIAIADAMHATDAEPNRFRYDDRPRKRCPVADPVIQWRRGLDDLAGWLIAYTARKSSIRCALT